MCPDWMPNCDLPVHRLTLSTWAAGRAQPPCWLVTGPGCPVRSPLGLRVRPLSSLLTGKRNRTEKPRGVCFLELILVPISSSAPGCRVGRAALFQICSGGTSSIKIAALSQPRPQEGRPRPGPSAPGLQLARPLVPDPASLVQGCQVRDNVPTWVNLNYHLHFFKIIVNYTNKM